MDVTKFQLKRVNPFQGLVIDADTWKDAHNYHRDQQRLHMLAFHKTGIVSGLDVSGNNPQDSLVNISPGLAVDPEGNVIIMPQQQRYRLQTRDKCTVYLVIQFREILTEPYQPPNGGQPTRIQEAFRIQERDQLPSEPYVELARIDFDPDQGAIKDARNSAKPAANKINLQFRMNSIKPAEAGAYTQPKEVPVPKKPSVLGIDGGINFTTDLIESLPVPELNTKDIQNLSSIADKIITAAKIDDYDTNPTKQAQIKEYKCQIDQMVYELYGLTEEEIGVVEGKK